MEIIGTADINHEFMQLKYKIYPEFLENAHLGRIVDPREILAKSAEALRPPNRKGGAPAVTVSVLKHSNDVIMEPEKVVAAKDLYEKKRQWIVERLAGLEKDAQDHAIKGLQKGVIVGFGYRVPEGDHVGGYPVPIPSEFWTFLRINFETGEAAGGGMLYCGLKFSFKSEVEGEDWEIVVEQINSALDSLRTHEKPVPASKEIKPEHPKALPGRPGRPVKWDWVAANRYLIEIANHPDGLPRPQTAIETKIKDFFSEHDPDGNYPSESQIRKFVAERLPSNYRS